MPIESPPIAGSAYDDLAGTTARLAEAYTAVPGVAGWKRQPSAAPDAGTALIHVFAHMADQVVSRVNLVPERHFLAFLNMIGVQQTPPQPARVPLTFALSPGAASAVVLAGTRVGATPADGDPAEIVFETTLDLAITPVSLAAVVVRDAGQDLSAVRTTDAAPSGASFYPIFQGDTPGQHFLYFTADAITSLGSGTKLTVQLDLSSNADPVAAATTWDALHSLQSSAAPVMDWQHYVDHPPTRPLVQWKYWSGSDWLPISGSPISGPPWHIAFDVPPTMTLATVNGRTARWIRAELVGWPAAAIPALSSAKIRYEVLTPRSGALDAVLRGGAPVDLSMDFYPFGERPAFNDTLYLGSNDIFSKKGASVTVTIDLADASPVESASDAPRLVWEAWTSSGWSRFTPTVELVDDEDTPPASPDDTFSRADLEQSLSRRVSFTVPAEVAPRALQGITSHWIRVRLAGGGYGAGVQLVPGSNPLAVTNDGYRPPIIASVSLEFRYAGTWVSADVLTFNEQIFTDVTGAASFVPFTRSADVDPALYLGFDGSFANRPTALYVQVSPLTPTDFKAGAFGKADSPPRVVWEYASGATSWLPLGARDETRAFAESGLVRFIGPSDQAPQLVLGRKLHWIRARFAGGTFAVTPRAGHVLTNTMWATSSTTIGEQVLGSSDQSASQRFSLPHAPVLGDVRVRVGERELLSATERAAIEQLEGGDAVTIALRPDGHPEMVWVRWHPVGDFFSSGPEDRHYVLDHVNGVVLFGDGRRGKVPPRGARNVIASSYRTGGGAGGNKPAGAITQLKTTVPYVDGVTNHEPASGGADRETVDRLKERGPRALRHGQRAVTVDDIQDLTLEASPAVARAKAITARFDPFALEQNPANVPLSTRVLVIFVPFGVESRPTPGVGLLHDVEAYLRARCPPAVTLLLSGPDWVRVSVDDLQIVPASIEGSDALRADVEAALERYLHPLSGGDDGAGWGFGKVPHTSDLHSFVMAIPGVESIVSLTLHLAYADRIEPFDEFSALAQGKLDQVLIFSGAHKVRLAAENGG